MPRKKPAIPQHRMDSHSPHGLLIRYTKDTHFDPPHEVSIPHRDDHYAFIYQQSGNNQLLVDFKKIKARGRAIFCLLPGQVHQVTNINDIDAWFVAAAAELVPAHVRTFFGQSLAPLQPVPVNDQWAVKLNTGLSFLQMHVEDPAYPDDPFQLVKSTTDSVLSMFAAIYHEQGKKTVVQEGRAAELTRRFNLLLQKQYKTIKSPAAYASLLNVSPAYLNEVVKKSTGMPVSYWIHQEIVLEAKRMLYYTDAAVKEIAFALGYDDHAYFTRLFGKAAGISPAVFRQKSRV
jgi:AraC-like DNA-binding protein